MGRVEQGRWGHVCGGTQQEWPVIGVDIASEEEFTRMLLRMPVELKEWLAAESNRSGRSQTWLVLHAVELWKDRLNKARKKERV